MTDKNNEQAIAELIRVMARLRDPDGGCPWDLVQTFESIAPYTIEEAYEVADAVERGDMTDLQDELGDLLLQVVYHAQMASEAGHFTFADVAKGVAEKMISRHPHVFGDQQAADAADVESRIWEEQKEKEKQAKRGNNAEAASILDDVTRALPATMRAQKLQKRAARVGFEWPEAVQVLNKIEEEIAELRAAITANDQDNIHEETGDMLFCVINLGRMLGVDCETALRDVNSKFERRFRAIEDGLRAQNIKLGDATLSQMEQLWQDAKKLEKAAS